MGFPALYHKDSKNNIKKWSINVENNSIVIKYGLINGVPRNLTIDVDSGKNIGKSNETTKEEQALRIAQSKWNAKKNSGYSEIKPDINKEVVEYANVRPMLALDYNKRHKDISEPFYIQPKLDGVRGLYMNGQFYSRMNKKYIGLEHIKYEILNNIKKNIPILDGELYSDTLTFQELISRLKNAKLDQSEIKYHVYDIITDDIFADRYKWILNNLYNFSTLKIVETHKLSQKSFISDYHDKYIKMGYEGVMIRNANGKYVKDYRSKDLQKYKIFKEDEYEIVGYKDGDSIEKGCVIWICKISDKEFSVRPEGSQKSRKELYKNGDNYIGKKLTVKYQELTDEGIPRFPVGKTIRDFE